MVGEAVERLNLMGAHYMETSKILFERQAELKIVVNHEEKSIRRKKITDEEREMIDKIEEEYGFFVYYLIGDRTGDGLTDPPGRIGRKLIAFAVIKFLNRLDQT